MPHYVHILGPLVLVFLSVPLALLAVVTTALALTTLLVRASLVYLEVGVDLLHGWLSNTPASLKIESLHPTQQSASPPTQRPGSKGTGLMSPFNEPSSNLHTPHHSHASSSDGLVSLLGSGGPIRDFEGVGGWRFATDGQDEANWMSMNSRLQLPAPATPVERHRRHKRSLSSQSQRSARSPEAFRLSPVDSRNRTPPAMAEHDAAQEYFTLQGGRTDMSPEEVTTKVRMDERRLSVSSSSASSVGDLKIAPPGFTQLQPPGRSQ